jgi:hypothetical protein
MCKTGTTAPNSRNLTSGFARSLKKIAGTRCQDPRFGLHAESSRVHAVPGSDCWQHRPLCDRATLNADSPPAPPGEKARGRTRGLHWRDGDARTANVNSGAGEMPDLKVVVIAAPD